jgi:carbon monoxide dehydrogenase subunit G
MGAICALARRSDTRLGYAVHHIEPSLQLEFSGTPEIDAGRDHVWNRLIDLEFVASCVTDVDEVRTIDPTHFQVLTGVRFGIVRFRFRVNVKLHDIVPHNASMTANAHAPGARVTVNTSIRLDALSETRTRLSWEAVANLEGIIAKIGARLLEKEGRETIEEFWREFAHRTATP